jgi:hypothetical protein
VTIGAVEVFWIVTEWPNGASAITFTAIGVILFTPRADEAYATTMRFMPKRAPWRIPRIWPCWPWTLKAGGRLQHNGRPVPLQIGSVAPEMHYLSVVSARYELKVSWVSTERALQQRRTPITPARVERRPRVSPMPTGWIVAIVIPVLAQKSNRPRNRFADEACGRRFLIIRTRR